MAIVERESRVSSPEKGVPAILVLILLLILLLGCEATSPATSQPEYAYRDPAIPEVEHNAIVRALGDLAGSGTHGRLKAASYFDEMGPALGVRLVPYWSQLMDHPDQEVRLGVARLVIKFCGRSSTPLLVDFLEWQNEAVRRDAYGKLRLVTGTEFGYRYDAPEKERAEAVSAIRARINSAPR